MDQEFFDNSIEKLKHRVEEGDLKKAIYIADNIDWTEVKDANLLIYVSILYEDYKDYDSARDLLLLAYDVAPVKSKLYYALTNIYIKLGNLKKAQEYYYDFCDAFPYDNKKILLRYYFLKKKGADLLQRCRVLEEYVEDVKDEETLFELALLYEEMGEKTKVVSTCEYIVDFFGVKKNGFGKKALELKRHYEPLTTKEEKLLNDIVDNDNEVTKSLAYQNISRPHFKIVKEKEEIEREQEEENIKVEKIKRDVISEATLFGEVKNEDPHNIKYRPETMEKLRDKEISPAFMSKDVKNVKTHVEKEKEINDKIDHTIFNKYRIKSFKRKDENMKLNELKQNMIIEAYSRQEAFDIACDELKYLHKARHDDRKVAKTSAYNLNERGFVYYIDKLADRDLIIEKAGQLQNEVLDEIEEFVLRNQKKNIIVLCDIINNFDMIAKNRPSFIDRFDVYSVMSERGQDETILGDDSDINKDFSNPTIKGTEDFIVSKMCPTTIKGTEENIVGRQSQEKLDIEDNDKSNNQRDDYDSRDNVNKQNNANDEKTHSDNSMQKKNLYNNHFDRYTDDGKEHVRVDERPVKVEKVQREKTYEEKMAEIKRNNTRELSVDEFVEFCKKYARSIDCNMPGKTIPALYERIEMMVEEGIALTEKRAEDLIERAADKAEKPRLFSKPKYDKEGNLIIQEEHIIG